ncbi:MAG: MFS transporter [Erysipelotrichaceae bacterium]
MHVVTRKQMNLFFLVVAIQSLGANFAHPITPTIIVNLNLPDYMFGLAFAGMAFTNFLFSPFWGKISTYTGSRLILLICCIGYGVGQATFGIATSQMSIMLARLTSGFFVGGIMVCYLTYVINTSPLEERGRNLTIMATLSTVFSAFGYLVGGLVGDISIPFTFFLQTFTLCLSGVLFYVFMIKDKNEHVIMKKVTIILKEANPFSSFIDAKSFLNKILIVLFMVVLLTSIATTAYEQCFNFYIKDQFQFTSAYNGALKAIVGFISLIANGTICMRIMRHYDVKHALVYVLIGCSLTMLGIVLLDNIVPFILINVVFFAFNAIYIPLLQDVVAKSATSENSGILMGFFNAIKSLGMIVGALFAGFIYAFGAKLSFLYAFIFFGIAALLMIWHNIMRNKKDYEVK